MVDLPQRPFSVANCCIAADRLRRRSGLGPADLEARLDAVRQT